MSVFVPATTVPSTGSIRATPPRPTPAWQPRPQQQRRLDARAIRQTLPATPQIMSLRLRLITDLSGSMGTFGGGGNDPTGTRHEAALIAIEHIAATTKQFDVRVMSFDRNSPVDLPWTRYTRRHRQRFIDTLLAHPNGGSSCLDGALRETERDLGSAEAVLVMSDFELLDRDPTATLARLVMLPTSSVTAMVFTSPPPPQLDDSGVTVVRVDPTTTSPTEIAAAIVRSALDAIALEDGQ